MGVPYKRSWNIPCLPKLIKDVGFNFLKGGEVTFVTQKDVVNYTKLWIQCEKGTSTLTWIKDVKM